MAGVSVTEIYEAVLDLIETVGARPWWISLRLITVARDSWHVLGPIMLESVDARDVSLAAWLDILLVKTLHAMDPKSTTMFTSRLELPPPEEQAEESTGEVEMEMDRGAFLSLA